MRNSDWVCNTVNNVGKHEFFPGPTGRCYYPNWWRDNKMTKMLRGRSDATFSFIELGAQVIDWTVPDGKREKVMDAMARCVERGPSVTQHALMLSLKNECASVFTHHVASEFVKEARLRGWFPMFLLKNAYLQQSSHTPKQHTLSSLDKTPKSYLCLIAFWKYHPVTKEPLVLPFVNAHQRFLRLTNKALLGN